MRRPIAALVVVVGLAVTVGAVLASSGSGGAFSRYASIANPEQAATTSIALSGKDAHGNTGGYRAGPLRDRLVNSRCRRRLRRQSGIGGDGRATAQR